MNAAHAAGYVGLSDCYPSCSYFNHVNQTMGLLTEQERARLDSIDLDKGGNCSRGNYCMVFCRNRDSTSILSEHLASDLRKETLGLLGQIGALYNANDLPIPFFYLHFICLLTYFYLPLFAVTAAIQAGASADDSSWVGGLVRGLTVVLQAIFVIGLRVLGQKLNDPYGDDLIDLSVMYYVEFTWRMSGRILNSHFPEAASATVEDALKRARDPLGDAWEQNKYNNFGSAAFQNVSLAPTQQEESADIEAQLPPYSESRIVSNPSFGNLSVHTPHSMASHSRIVFNPALRESDLDMVAL